MKEISSSDTYQTVQQAANRRVFWLDCVAGVVGFLAIVITIVHLYF